MEESKEELMRLNNFVIVVFCVLTCAMIGGELAMAQQNRVLVIGVDGLRPDAMEFANTPNIDALISNGIYNSLAQGEDLTFSGPNWSSVLHGVHRDRHGVNTNSHGAGPFGSYTGNNFASHPDLFTILEGHDSSLTTARFTSWTGIHSQPTGADINVFNSAGSHLGGAGDILNTAAAVNAISNQNAATTFLYLHDPDSAGHTVSYDSWLNGGGAPQVTDYIRAIQDVDSQIGQVLTAINGRATIANENWLIVLTSDHGGRGTGHAGNTPDRRTVPFIVSGDAVLTGENYPGPKNLDVARTVLTHMGVSQAEMAGLDGRAFGLSSSPLPDIGFGANLIFNGDAEYDRGFTDTQYDHAVSGWNDPGQGEGTPTVTALEYGHDYWNGMQTPAGSDTGNNFFHGGRQAQSNMTQLIDVSQLAVAVDGGGVEYAFSALLGGLSGQDDNASVIARFLDGGGLEIGSDALSAVLDTDRNGQTAILFRESLNSLPIGTRRVEIDLRFTRDAGLDSNGFADNLSFVLVPEPSAAVLLAAGWALCMRRRPYDAHIIDTLQK